MLLGLTYLILAFANVDIPWGNPTLVMLISLFSGIQLLSLGVMGEYVGRIYDEVKRRPMFVDRDARGIRARAGEGGRAAGASRGAPQLTLPPVCILAGGRGTRLGALTNEVPKPLLPVAGRPFVEHQLELLKAHGAQRIVLSVGYLGEQIEAAIGDGSRFGLEISLRPRRAGARRNGRCRSTSASPSRRGVPRPLRRHVPADRLRRRRTARFANRACRR